MSRLWRFLVHVFDEKRNDGPNLGCWQRFLVDVLKGLRWVASQFKWEGAVKWLDKQITKIDPSYNVKGHDDPGPHLAVSA